MVNCAYCGTDILFGGIRAGNLRYCKQACQQKAEEAEQNIAQSRQDYEGCLAQLRQNPGDPHLHQKALEAGRVHAAWKRHNEGGRITVYDETSIANEIAAASAAASSSRTGRAKDSSSIEDRLERLEVLKSKDLVTAEEYRTRREAILAEL